jgi:hypothetical protein
MTVNDGGQAFPLSELGMHGSYGMTLRDYFAGEELSSIHGKTICSVPEDYDRIADHCYRMADAMLRARERKSS